MKGIWYMVEALVAGMVLITFLVTLKATFLSATPQEEASFEAYTILKELDESGNLRSYAVANDFNGLNSEINIYYYDHLVEICNPQGTCFGTKPTADNVWVGSYAVSGDSGFAPRIVNLYLWRQA